MPPMGTERNDNRYPAANMVALSQKGEGLGQPSLTQAREQGSQPMRSPASKLTTCTPELTS